MKVLVTDISDSSVNHQIAQEREVSLLTHMYISVAPKWLLTDILIADIKYY